MIGMKIFSRSHRGLSLYLRRLSSLSPNPSDEPLSPWDLLNPHDLRETSTTCGNHRPPLFDVDLYCHAKLTRRMLMPVLLEIRDYAIEMRIYPTLKSKKELENVLRDLGHLSLFSLDTITDCLKDTKRPQFCKDVYSTFLCFLHDSDYEEKPIVSKYLRWRSKVELTLWQRRKQMKNASFEVNPDIVGNKFVRNYYIEMYLRPSQVGIFYLDNAVLGRPDSDGEMVNTTRDHITSFMDKNSKFHIMTADSQATCSKGVVTLVTGLVTLKDGKSERFSQSFFLVPVPLNENYLVLNDLFRHVSKEIDEIIPQVVKSHDPHIVTYEFVHKYFNRFVHEYYTCLSLSPEIVHLFYLHDSVLGRPGSDGEMVSVKSLQAIKDQIRSFHYINSKVHILTVDSQASCNKAFVTLVTGLLTLKDGERKRFSQSFILVPRSGSYFVLNDIFRYDSDEYVEPEAASNDVDAPKSIWAEMKLGLSQNRPIFNIKDFPVAKPRAAPKSINKADVERVLRTYRESKPSAAPESKDPDFQTMVQNKQSG